MALAELLLAFRNNLRTVCSSIWLGIQLTTYQVTPPPFFFFALSIIKLLSSAKAASEKWHYLQLWRNVSWSLLLLLLHLLIQKRWLRWRVPKASSTSSCHCPPSKHIVAPLSLVFPSFLKKKALHVLWYKKVDHSSWAVKRTLLLLLPPLVVVILIVFFSFRTKELVHTCPMANQ